MQGFNRYYRPDYDPNDVHKGNLNRIAGKAAPKAVVRFEMPFNIWCLSCDKHIAQGVRFNAQKKKIGNYFSSPIYQFNMTCHLCQAIIEIATNPKDTCYDIISGAKKKAEEWNAEVNGTFHFEVDSAQAIHDPIHKLEQDSIQKQNNRQSATKISQLIASNKRQWSDPYTQSQKLRKEFRIEKKKINRASELRRDIEDRHALAIPLLPAEVTDRVLAKAIDFQSSVDPSDSILPHSQSTSNSTSSRLSKAVREATKTKTFPFGSTCNSGKNLQTGQQHLLTGVGKAAQALVNYDSDE